MTVIAWDGKRLAADRRLNGGTGYQNASVTKIKRLPSGALLGCCGGMSFCQAIFAWMEAGADPDLVDKTWFEHEEMSAQAILILPDKTILLYEHVIPIPIESPFYAIGSGGSYATAAMHLGQNASKAVEIACMYDSECGNGVDVLELDE